MSLKCTTMQAHTYTHAPPDTHVRMHEPVHTHTCRSSFKKSETSLKDKKTLNIQRGRRYFKTPQQLGDSLQLAPVSQEIGQESESHRRVMTTWLSEAPACQVLVSVFGSFLFLVTTLGKA